MFVLLSFDNQAIDANCAVVFDWNLQEKLKNKQKNKQQIKARIGLTREKVSGDFSVVLSVRRTSCNLL